tara:strand:+ start:18471 stop:18704 length:234 start_codon:yes stop_codon:yes gene_type:complete
LIHVYKVWEAKDNGMIGIGILFLEKNASVGANQYSPVILIPIIVLGRKIFRPYIPNMIRHIFLSGRIFIRPYQLFQN